MVKFSEPPIRADDWVLISDQAQRDLAVVMTGTFVSKGPYRVRTTAYDAAEVRCADLGLQHWIRVSHLTRVPAPSPSLAEKEVAARGPEAARRDANLRSVFAPPPRRPRPVDWSDQ